MGHKKIRGIRRKYTNMKTSIIESTSTFPEITSKYWHLHLPTSYSFMNSPNLPDNLKIQCMQLLIDRAWRLYKLNKDKENHRVVIAITPEDLWSSQIIIFKDDDYFANFFSRNDNYEVWQPISKEEFHFEQYLSIPDEFSLIGYKEIIYDDGRMFAPTYISDIWFIGKL